MAKGGSAPEAGWREGGAADPTSGHRGDLAHHTGAVARLLHLGPLLVWEGAEQGLQRRAHLAPCTPSCRFRGKRPCCPPPLLRQHAGRPCAPQLPSCLDSGAALLG